jgi:hypothetical protein
VPVVVPVVLASVVEESLVESDDDESVVPVSVLVPVVLPPSDSVPVSSSIDMVVAEVGPPTPNPELLPGSVPTEHPPPSKPRPATHKT